MSKLTTVFFLTDSGYVKAIVDSRHDQFFYDMGAVNHQGGLDVAEAPGEVLEPEYEEDEDEVEDDDEEDIIISGDVGCGLPGSLLWDVASINQAESVLGVFVYMRDNITKYFDSDFDSDEELDELKKCAIRHCKEYRK